MILFYELPLFQGIVCSHHVYVAMNAPLIHVSISYVGRVFKVNVKWNLSLASSIKATHMADELWSRFVHALQCDPSFLDRTKLKKQIFQRKTECAKCRAADQMDSCLAIDASATFAEHGEPNNTRMIFMSMTADYMGLSGQLRATSTQDAPACENIYFTPWFGSFKSLCIENGHGSVQ